MGTYWDYSNADFATTLTLTFRLESGLPKRAFLRLTLPDDI
jgi:hypothetical protein